MTELISTDNATNGILSKDLLAGLRVVVGLMIPESHEYQVPGADDEKIFNDIAGSIGDEAEILKRGLDNLEELAQEAFNCRLVNAASEDLPGLMATFKSADREFIKALTSLVASCYYRDDRVMKSLGMERRPPFPNGFEVEQGDWSLLDPVRARGKLYRDVTASEKNDT